MTLVTGTFKDSKGSPITGFIRVRLDYLVVDTDTAYLPVAATVPLVNGAASLELEPSEQARVTYAFEVVQTTTTTDTTTNTTTTIESVVWSFRAKVPDSATAIQITDLIQTTGITNDALDSSLTAIIRRLHLSEDFWARLRTEVLVHKGIYGSTLWYQPGEVVSFQGSSYAQISNQATRGIDPTNTTTWYLLASIGNTGAGTSGNPSAYDPNGWLNQTDAPSRGAVRNIIETLATKTELGTKVSATNALLTNPSLAADPEASDRSSKVVSSRWVQSLLDMVRKALVPVGTISAFAGSSAPNGWVLCDGRTLDRTTYSALFAVLGTTYNIGGEATTVFRVPDLRGRVAVGMDAMSALQGSANRVIGAWADALGGNAGAETHTLALSEIPAHTHTALVGSPLTNFTPQAGTGIGGTTNGQTTGSTGGGQAHNNMQPSLALNAIIYAEV